MPSSIPLLLCFASTWFMTGLIWFVQVVHYPLFAQVGSEAFGGYHNAHVRLVTRVVLVPMVAELLTSLWLVYEPPSGVGSQLPLFGLAAAVLVWLSTILIQVPLHQGLADAFVPRTHQRLVATNAGRAWLWTAHAGIVLAMTAFAIDNH